MSKKNREHDEVLLSGPIPGMGGCWHGQRGFDRVNVIGLFAHVNASDTGRFGQLTNFGCGLEAAKTQ